MLQSKKSTSPWEPQSPVPLDSSSRAPPSTVGWPACESTGTLLLPPSLIAHLSGFRYRRPPCLRITQQWLCCLPRSMTRLLLLVSFFTLLALPSFLFLLASCRLRYSFSASSKVSKQKATLSNIGDSVCSCGNFVSTPCVLPQLAHFHFLTTVLSMIW